MTGFFKKNKQNSQIKSYLKKKSKSIIYLSTLTILIISLILQMYPTNFLNQLNLELPFSTQEKLWSDTLTSDSESIFFWNKYKENFTFTDDEIQVAIYCTHSSETYIPYSQTASVSGEHGGVYAAASVVAETLIEAGIGAVVDETIHDYPDWNLSYSNSLNTASQLLAKYPNLDLLIDLHRDAGVSKEDSTTTIDGIEAARIMLVVGSDQRYDHENWEVNQALMEMIGDRMEEMYPGLLRRVAVQSGRYNQQTTTGAILVEMGATENTIEEVQYSAQLLANVLASLFN